jgi:hypothetical protein
VSEPRDCHERARPLLELVALALTRAGALWVRTASVRI